MGNLAAAHSKVNEWENVLRVCARALEVCPHSVKPLLLRGRALMNRWRVAEAVESYRAALTAQEAALNDGVNRLSQVEADVAPNAPAVPAVGVDNAAPRPAAEAEMDKQKRIAAVMRNVSLTPPVCPSPTNVALARVALAFASSDCLSPDIDSFQSCD